MEYLPLVYVNHINDLANLFNLPQVIIKGTINAITFTLSLLLVVFILYSLIENDYFRVITKPFIQTIYLFLQVIILILILGIIIVGLFAITVPVIINLYNMHISYSLFKTLVSPVITLITLSFSAFGFVLSRSIINSGFENVMKNIKEMAKFYCQTIEEHKVIGTLVCIGLTIVTILIGIAISK